MLQPSSRPTLISLVEEHMSALVRQALAVQRHCKRARLVDDDSHAVKRRIHAADVNMALQLMGSEKLYANYNTEEGEGNTTSSESRKVNLEDFLRDSMPTAPAEVSLRQHWLAVDGVQPKIPQNPTTVVGKESQPSDAAAEEENEEEEEEGLQVNRLQSSLLSEELQLYFTRVTSAVERGAATADNRQQQDAVLVSISRDPGLQELVPFLVRYVQQELYKHSHNAEHCRTLVRLAHQGLLQNPHLHLELHLHELLPALMTCIVARKLAPNQNHWALRREAAACLVRACTVFGADYSTLKARVLRALCDAIGPEKSLASRYGGIVAITLFGPKAVDAFLAPIICDTWSEWEEEMKVVSAQRCFEIQMCQQALLDALGVFWRNVEPEERAERLDYARVQDKLADKWVALQGESDEYGFCFV